MVVADTNNSLLRLLSTKTGELSTLKLRGIPKPRRSPDGPAVASGAEGAAAEPPPGAVLVRAPASTSALTGDIVFSVTLPPGYHLTPGANSRFETSVLGGGSGGPVGATVRFSRTGGSGGSAFIRILAKVFFCQDNSVCLFQEVCFDVPLAAAEAAGGDAGAAPVVRLSHTLSAQAPVVTLPLVGL